jgi:electron transfer flavoprotein alpha subunit
VKRPAVSDFIALVKQVPDVTKISNNCFNPETGTLIRAKLPSVLNDLDSQALSLACSMRRMQDGNGKLVLLSMGPPMAEEVLRFGLRRGADAAVLLTDKAFGGADTVATANPLASAIRRVAKEYFDGSEDFYVVCGMQSVDGDTAQVPPQVAEDLGVTCLTYVTRVERRAGRFEFTRITAGGSQVLAPRKLPAVLTVAKYDLPLFPSLAATRKSLAMPVVKWGAGDVQASLLGLEGSKTSVFKVFQPDKSSRKCVAISDAAHFVKTIVESFRSEEGGNENKAGVRSEYLLPSRRLNRFDRRFEAAPRDFVSFDFLTGLLTRMNLPLDRDLAAEEKAAVVAQSQGKFTRNQLEELLASSRGIDPSFPGEVWVMAEHSQGRLASATCELLGKARDLAGLLDAPVGAVLAGHGIGHLSEDLIAGGADKVYLLDHALLENFDPLPWRKAVAGAVTAFRPGIFLFSATAQGRTLAPLVSYRTKNGLTADCTGLDIRDMTLKRKCALLFQTRPALGGNIMATIYTKNSTTQMATARPGVFKSLSPDASRRGEVVSAKVDLSESDASWDIIRNEVADASANFHAQVIVSGGKGVRTKPNYAHLIGTLADALSGKLGTPVEKGASRAAVEQGFVERAYQVGQTGTAVSPKIYLALGISGAIQHMIGIANTKTIFAVNNDPNAPIFKQCDYYLVGNVEEIVPKLVAALKE